MFKGLITPCKECVKEKCGLWVELTWKNEQTKQEEKRGECSIVGVYGFLARIENRMIATQKAAEEARNVSAETKVRCEKMINENAKAINNFGGVIYNLMKISKRENLKKDLLE